jgi:ADP-ribose pyrophosphatase YjhB (NUDIX family)
VTGIADGLRVLADQLRVIAETGIHYAGRDGLPYDVARYEQVRTVSAQLFALVDLRSVDEVEQTVFSQLTHRAPIPCGDAAVFDDDGRILLIQRADDQLWAMPGGGFDMGETPAQGVAREALEETGYEVEIVDLVGVYDSRFCETVYPLQLFHFVFRCRIVGERRTAKTPNEVLDVQWFSSDALPPLSPGHTVRVPDAFGFVADGQVRFDRP